MKGVNKVILLGNLGQNPEVKYTQSGTAVANFSIATNERKKQGEEWVDHVEWHRVIAWDKLAKVACDYLKKGSPVYIEGKIQTRKWEDKEGATRYTTEVVARELVLLSNGNQGGGGDKDAAPADDLPF